MSLDEQRAMTEERRPLRLALLARTGAQIRREYLEHLVELVDLGFEVLAISGADDPVDELSELGIETASVPALGSATTARDLASIPVLVAHLSEPRPALLHCVDPSVLAQAVAARSATGVPLLVATISSVSPVSRRGASAPERGRTTPLDRLRRRLPGAPDLSAAVGRRLGSQLDAIISPSEEAAAWAEPAAPAIIPGGCGVPVDRFSPGVDRGLRRDETRAALGIPRSAVVVARVRYRSPKIARMPLIGGASDRDSAADLVALSGTSVLLSVDIGPIAWAAGGPRVEDRGEGWVSIRTDGSDLPDIYAASDIALVPRTQDDPTGISTLEAMAAGLAVVAVDDPLRRELVIDGSTGELVALGDAATWTRAVRRYTERAYLRDDVGRRASARVVELDRRRTQDATFSVYDRLLRRAAGHGPPNGHDAGASPFRRDRTRDRDLMDDERPLPLVGAGDDEG